MNAIYARANQDEAEELRAQIRRCKELAQLQGEQIDAGRIYTDAGGWRLGANRIGFEELSADIENGIIDRVYIDSLDRLGRSVDVTPIIEGWQDNGVTVIAVSPETKSSSRVDFRSRR